VTAASQTPDEEVHLSPYDPTWPAQFEREARVLAEALGPHLTGGLHHVGSTAVPGLTAKLVIDIMAGVTDLASAWPCVALLTDLGYCYALHRPDVMHWFCKPNPARRTHHLHLVPTGSPRFTDVLAFRDYLRTHPAAAEDYAKVKQQLATQHAHDRDAYTNGKNTIVAAITASAHHWQNSTAGAE
jgi:GrpB-like predicted nucleotidyltransferase (UPF0157 family)